ncbi:prolyl-tRNA synthetase associated domain-containing protein [Lientehia hominis]
MNGIWIDEHLYTGRPSPDGRLPKEMRVYDLLDSLKMPYVRIDHDVTPSIESCQHVDELLGIEICKNLFLCNSQKTDFYLLMLPGTKKFRTAALSKQIGTSRLSFAPAEYMEQYLDIAPGSVSVMGLMNDKQNKVHLLIDKKVLEAPYLGCHPCVNTSSLRLSTKDLLDKFLPYTGHNYLAVEL